MAAFTLLYLLLRAASAMDIVTFLSDFVLYWISDSTHRGQRQNLVNLTFNLPGYYSALERLSSQMLLASTEFEGRTTFYSEINDILLSQY